MQNMCLVPHTAFVNGHHAVFTDNIKNGRILILYAVFNPAPESTALLGVNPGEFALKNL